MLRSARGLGVGLVVVGLLAALVWVLHERGALPRADLQDFVEYWAAGRLNARGANPYDAADLYAQERAVSPGLTEAIMMWNPPWMLSLAMPFGLLPAHAAYWLWLAGQLAAVLYSADWLWRFFGGPARRRWLAWLVCLGFIPTLFLLRMGQVSGFVLLGVVLFLRFQAQGRDACAGAAMVLAALKPHLLVPFGAAVVLWAVRGRRWHVFAGAAGALVALSVAPVLCNPDVFDQYREAMAHRTPEMMSPTLGSVLRLLLGPERLWLQFVPPVLGIVWAVDHWRRRSRAWDWRTEAPVLVLVSFLVAPYGAWPFDVVVLLVAVIRAAADVVAQRDVARAAFGVTVLVGFDVAAWLLRNVHYTQYYWYAWTTPLLLYAYLVLRRPAPSGCAVGVGEA